MLFCCRVSVALPIRSALVGRAFRSNAANPRSSSSAAPAKPTFIDVPLLLAVPDAVANPSSDATGGSCTCAERATRKLCVCAAVSALPERFFAPVPIVQVTVSPYAKLLEGSIVAVLPEQEENVERARLGLTKVNADFTLWQSTGSEKVRVTSTPHALRPARRCWARTR